MYLSKRFVVSFVIIIILVFAILVFTYFRFILNRDLIISEINEVKIVDIINLVISLSLVIVTIIYVVTTRNILRENIQQRQFLESPFVYVSIEPDSEQGNFFFVRIRNTGNSTAYNIKVKFSNELYYINSTSINDLQIFKNLPVLSKDEEISFFLSAIPEFFKFSKFYQSEVSVSYNKYPSDKYIATDKYVIDLNIYRSLAKLKKATINDLVSEMKQLKEAIIIKLSNE
ncbi:MAG: hypothetical protein HND52_15570 [Ignavibacteriae bacterium]|nr:hypothetical protein [Ignavibacteriota bacterium]NOG99375.1 hypothetical protein [Ignavibacteriota bacterium]